MELCVCLVITNLQKRKDKVSRLSKVHKLVQNDSFGSRKGRLDSAYMHAYLYYEMHLLCMMSKLRSEPCVRSQEAS